jgi:4-amino-4-deoxy-L-arabinose transferase-like glycosyltransferase
MRKYMPFLVHPSYAHFFFNRRISKMVAVNASGVCALLLYALLLWRRVQGVYSHSDILLFLSSILLAGFALWRKYSVARQMQSITKSDVSVLTLLIFFTVLINVLGITSWNFSGIGDEGTFYGYARNIANGADWSFFYLFAIDGVHPSLDSAYVGLLMHFFGQTIFTWRISEILIHAAIVGIVYLFGRVFFGKICGIVAGVVLGSSHYLMAFTKIGYNTTHSLLYSSVALLLLLLALKSRRPVHLFFAGVLLGFCRYTSLLALITWPIAAALVLFNVRYRVLRKEICTFSLLLLGFSAVILPLLVSTPLSEHVRVFTVETHFREPTERPWTSRLLTVRDSFLIWWQNPRWYHHYVGGTLIDSLSGVLLLIGLVLCAWRITRAEERTVLLWFVLGVVLIGGSNYVVQPSITRLLYVLPSIALIIGIAVEHVWLFLRHRIPVPALRMCLVILLIAIPALNLYQLFLVSPLHTPMQWHQLQLKALQEYPQYSVIEVGTDGSPDYGFVFTPGAYPWLARRYSFIPVTHLSNFSLASHRAPAAYLVVSRNAAVLPAVREILPNHKEIPDADPRNHSQSWVFLPG